MNAVSTKLEIINLALGELGQKQLTQAQLSALADDNAVVMDQKYDLVRLGLIRQFCFEFCTEMLALAQIDPNGLVITGSGYSAADGAYDYDTDAETFSHVSNDVVFSKASGSYVAANAAGTETYFSTTETASWPWEVTRWSAGDDGALPAPRIHPGTPRDFGFLYERPADCVTPWAIWNPASRKPDDRIRFKPFCNEWIATDQDDAVLVYARDEEDMSLFDPLFVQCFAKALALANYVVVKGSDKGIGVLQNDLNGLLNLTKKIDAGAQHEDRAATIGRRYLDLG